MKILQRNLSRSTFVIPLHFSHNKRTPVQISLQYLIGVRIIKEMPVSVVSGTPCICAASKENCVSHNTTQERHQCFVTLMSWLCKLTLSDPMSDLVRQYDFPVPLRCQKTSDMVFVMFVRPLSEPVRCFSSCSKDFSQQIAQVVLFLFPCVFLF